ncbi:hypothetical protein N8287_00360 [bacterium]|nr:hypothetical protein [bacterium]|tara:strand:+ start:646 stop:2277 length:1632 start_codon:yes stop_codon:yes gene_type:complete
MKKNYLLLLLLALLSLAISCDTDKLEEELDGADIIAPNYDGIIVFSLGNIEYTVDSLLADAGDDLEYYTNSAGIIVFKFNESDTVDIDEELGEQPDLDFDVELIQTLEVPAISFAIDFFEEFDGGAFEVESPKLSFNFKNTLQIPSSLQFLKFQAVKYDENGLLKESVDLIWNDPADSLQPINTPTRLDTAKKETLDIYLDETNSNLRDMLSIQPDSLTMEIGFVAFPDVLDTVIYFRIDTLGPYVTKIDTLEIDSVTFAVTDTIWMQHAETEWSPDPAPSNMTIIDPSDTVIQIAADTDGDVYTTDDWVYYFDLETGSIVEEFRDEAILETSTFTHEAGDYELLDTVFVGTDLSSIDPKYIEDEDGNIAWAIVITKWTALYGLNSGAKIESDVVMELPVVINLTDLTVTQEMDFNNKNDITDLLDDLEDNDQDIPTTELTLTAVNELPLGISIDMKFLDTDSVQLYSQEDVQLIAAPTSPAEGMIESSTSSNTITLDGDAITALKTTETIQLVLSLNTPDGVFLPLLKTAAVNITLSIKVTN